MSNVAILIPSCDKYSDLWKPFFDIFWRRWPDCPYPVYLGSNSQTYPDDRVKNLSIGEDESWAVGVTRMLDEIPATHIILILEDFFLVDDVDTGEVERVVKIAMDNQVACLRLRANEGPTHALAGHPGIGRFAVGEPYRVSAQAAVWDVSQMRKLLLPEFSAWDFEHTGSYLSDHMGLKLWGVFGAVVNYRHVVEKGRWLPRGLLICHHANVQPDFDARPAMTLDQWETHERSSKRCSVVDQMTPKFVRRLVRRLKRRSKIRKYL